MMHGASGKAEDPMAAERPLWDEYWHLLCHRSELAAAHEFVKLDIFGEEVVAFHDGLEAVVFNNRCPHRGTRIFEGSHGTQRWVCPYHGWSFSKGRLFVTMKEDFIGSDPAEARLDRYETAWLGDFLFASKRPAQPLEAQIGGVAEIVEGISRSIESRRDFNAYPYGCNWKIAVENALDQYHVGLIHRDSLNRLKLDPARDEYVGINNLSYAGVGDERVARQLKGLGRFFELAYQSEGYIAVHLFPFTFLTSTFGYSYSLQQFYPTGDPDRTAFASRFYAARLSGKMSPDAMETFFQSSIAVNHQVFAEDNAICSRVPTDTWSPEPPLYLSRGEEKLIHFRKVMAKVLGRGGPAGAV